jgi:hypothetical protein
MVHDPEPKSITLAIHLIAYIFLPSLHQSSFFSIPMVSTKKFARAKLTTEQKAERRQRFVKLTDAINTARDSYQEEARSISQDHGR